MVFSEGWARVAGNEGSSVPGYALLLCTKVSEAEKKCVSSLNKVLEL